MPTIKQLNQKNPSLDCDEIEQLRALYKGGKAFKAKLGTFLPKRHAEPVERYSLRKSEAVYRNYVGPIIDYFTALLFSARPEAVAKLKGADAPLADPGDYYNTLREDCDRTGRDVDAAFKWLLTEAMVTQRAWVMLEHPDLVEGANNLTKAQFDAGKFGDTWLRTLCAEDVLDWGLDDSGNLAWAIVYSKRTSRAGIESGHDDVTHTWNYLLPDRVDTYQLRHPSNKPPADDAEVPNVKTSPHRYGAVPLVCLDLPDGLWVASRLETPQLAHFRLSNAQTWGMTATCYAMPVVKVDDPDKFTKQTMGAGYGFVIKPNESVEWAAPPPGPFAELSTEIRSQKDEIFRIANTMALGSENNAATIGRSAESKHADAEATKVALLGYSRQVKEAIERVYDLISRGRGDEYVWSIGGLDDFAAADIGGLLDSLEKVQAIGGIPSKTWNTGVKTRLAQALWSDMDQATKAKVATEIQAGTEDQTTEARESRERDRLQAISGNLKTEGDAAKQKSADTN